MRTVFLLSLALLTAGCSCSDDEVKNIVIRTQNGRHGVYCTRAWDRTSCYQFVSKECPEGYRFLRETDSSVVVECKRKDGS